eukprot:scaffold50038_cov41-Attheya_sp.AAC.1
MLATVCSSALLLIAFLGNHVADACSCSRPPDDPCPALLSRNLLVRATIIGSTKVWDKGVALDANGDPDDPYDQFFTNHYSVKIEEVYVNAGAPSMVEGQTIEIRAKVASNLCGVSLQTGSDMLLDLFPTSNGEYFSTSSCSMNAGIDENGAIIRSEFNKCFEHALRLKGQSYVAPGPPVWPKDPPTPTKAQNGAAKKKKKAAKKALKKKKKKKAAMKKIWEECPRHEPNKQYACNLPAKESCGYGKCQGPSTGVFDAFTDKTKCQKKRQCTCEKGIFTCKTNKPQKVPDPRPICPTSPKYKMMCTENYAPVICNASCTYTNQCKASSFGWNAKECVRTN